MCYSYYPSVRLTKADAVMSLKWTPLRTRKIVLGEQIQKNLAMSFLD